MATSGDKSVLCPSAPPDWSDAKVFGVVLGTADAPRVGYLAEPLPVTEEILALTGSVPATEVLLIVSPCAAGRCATFGNGRCTLVDSIVDRMEVVTDALPPCRIRPTCRWWSQHGPDACRRCPQIVTDARAESTSAA